MGRLAVNTYRAEFGSKRSYVNLPYFSDLSRFSTAAETASKKPEGVSFLFSGSLVRRKGVDLLVPAFVRIASEFPDARLRLLGDGPLAGSVRQQTAHLGNRCEFLGFRDWGALPSVYAQSRILCAPSRHDGWGLIVPEGLAAGLPVITTNRTGAGVEFVQTGRNGWLIEADNGEALFSAMRLAALLHDVELRQLSLSARASVQEHSLAHGAERFLDAASAAVRDWQLGR
jgi:glycosyltransferase involved in cell wall biosynthesis